MKSSSSPAAATNSSSSSSSQVQADAAKARAKVLARAKQKDALEWKVFEIQSYLTSIHASETTLVEAKMWMRPRDYDQGNYI